MTRLPELGANDSETGADPCQNFPQPFGIDALFHGGTNERADLFSMNGDGTFQIAFLAGNVIDAVTDSNGYQNGTDNECELGTNAHGSQCKAGRGKMPHRPDEADDWDGEPAGRVKVSGPREWVTSATRQTGPVDQVTDRYDAIDFTLNGDQEMANFLLVHQVTRIQDAGAPIHGDEWR